MPYLRFVGGRLATLRYPGRPADCENPLSTRNAGADLYDMDSTSSPQPEAAHV